MSSDWRIHFLLKILDYYNGFFDSKPIIRHSHLRLSAHFPFPFIMADDTKMFSTYPTTTVTITGVRPSKCLKMKVVQRNAIRLAIPQDVRQKP